MEENWESGHMVEKGMFSDDHPAQYDQKTAEIAEKLQRCDGYVVYLYTRSGTRDNGDIEGEGHCVVGITPGITSTMAFLREAAISIKEAMLSSFRRAAKECDHDETER